MKNIKKIKLILMILICIFIILVGFIGVYLKTGNTYKNLLPEYALAPDLKGATILELDVDNSNETVYYDKDGNKVDSSSVTDENKDEYISEDIPVNKPDVLTLNNYKQTLDIMKQRLKFLKTDQYELDLDEKTGKIVLTFEDDYPDDIMSTLPMEGKLELIDSNTNDVIIASSDFASAQASYASTDYGYTAYIQLKLNDSGIEKINNIDKYKLATNTESEENTEQTANKLKVMFDKEKITEITYDDVELIGKNLRITTASNLTSNASIQSQLNTNSVVAKIASIGKSPIIYKITAEEYIKSNEMDYLIYSIIVLAAIIICIGLYFVLRFKWNGLLAVLGSCAVISLFLIIIRLTQVEISLNGLAGMLILILLNTILVRQILTCIEDNNSIFSENIKKAYLKSADVFVITLIVFAVFSFSAMTVINSMGLLVFWGWLAILLGNLAITVPMLSISNKKIV